MSKPCISYRAPVVAGEPCMDCGRPPGVHSHVRVRIAVAVTSLGHWVSEGWAEGTDAQALEEVLDVVDALGERIGTAFLEADVPMPAAVPAEEAP